MWAGYSERYLPNATKTARARVLVSKYQTSKHFGLWLQNCTFNPTRLKITKKKKKKGPHHFTSQHLGYFLLSLCIWTGPTPHV